MVLIGVSGACAVVRRQETLTVGMVGATANFVFFDDRWRDLHKVAVFRQGSVTKDYAMTGDTAIIPWEVLQIPGVPVHIGICGKSDDGAVVIPTIWAKTAPVRHGADPSGDESYTPTPDVAAQLLAQIAELKENGGVREVYVQDTEPLEAPDGSVWINMSEDDFGEPAPEGSEPSRDGGYYVPTITQVDESTATISFAASKPSMALVDDVTVTLPAGKDAAAPKLTDEQKSALFSLMNRYYNNRSLFCYDWYTTRNYYANNRCWKDFYKEVTVTDAEGNPVYNEDGSVKKETVYSRSLFRLCCATLAELVWMGRDITDFKGKDGDTYNNGITPAFDWGYYFQYKDRAGLGGVAKRENGAVTGYYKFRSPLGTDEYSYSVNTKYSADRVGDVNFPHAQEFNGFMMANDMAKELYHMGCEIPFEQLEQGDLVFIGDKWSESVNEYLFIQNTRFRGISHVAMVYKIVDGVVWLIDSTDDEFDTEAGTGLSILLCRENHSAEMSTRARAIYMLGNVVMCARHPAAWGKSNMAEVSSIDFMPMAYTDGLSKGRAIPVDLSGQPLDVEAGRWYLNGNQLGEANTSGTVSAWEEIEFKTLYT